MVVHVIPNIKLTANLKTENAPGQVCTLFQLSKRLFVTTAHLPSQCSPPIPVLLKQGPDKDWSKEKIKTMPLNFCATTLLEGSNWQVGKENNRYFMPHTAFVQEKTRCDPGVA